MDLNSVPLVKRVMSAGLLTGMVLLSVTVTQPKTVDKPVSFAENNASVASMEPRIYTPRENVSSRAEQPVKPAVDFTYLVKQGDTLYELALAYGVTVEQIKAANGLNSDRLALNQQLLIPSSGKVVVKKVSQSSTVKPKTSGGTVSRTRYSGRVVGELIHWNQAQKIFAQGDIATVIDVNTGYSFKIKRKGGHNHADAEPLTSTDTALMKQLYGSWSWDRRAVVIVIDDKKIAASMAGMPHGSQTIGNNKFPGHFDIHFYGSMTHGSVYTKSRSPMVDPEHQAMVRRAAGQ